MTNKEAAPTGRIGRPPKVDQHGTPTRDRLLQAAVDACIEFVTELRGDAISQEAGTVSAGAMFRHRRPAAGWSPAGRDR